jgi:probable phosphomutase (TIGR03848 family)
MATVILVRHGRSTANTSGVLAGRTRGVLLDETGRAQAEHVGTRLASLPLAAVVTSPLERCRDTAKAIVAAQSASRPDAPGLARERSLLEVDYGAWSGRELASLAKEPLWGVVQRHPSAAEFPEGESLAAMAARAVAAVRRWDAAVEAEHGADAVWVAVSHGDVLKAVLADALGMHLDSFQRIVVDPASVSVVRYAPERAFVLMTNTHDGDLGHLRPAPRKRSRTARRASSDAAVGGGAGPGGSGRRRGARG